MSVRFMAIVILPGQWDTEIKSYVSNKFTVQQQPVPTAAVTLPHPVPQTMTTTATKEYPDTRRIGTAVIFLTILQAYVASCNLTVCHPKEEP